MKPISQNCKFDQTPVSCSNFFYITANFSASTAVPKNELLLNTEIYTLWESVLIISVDVHLWGGSPTRTWRIQVSSVRTDAADDFHTTQWDFSLAFCRPSFEITFLLTLSKTHLLRSLKTSNVKFIYNESLQKESDSGPFSLAPHCRHLFQNPQRTRSEVHLMRWQSFITIG